MTLRNAKNAKNTISRSLEVISLLPLDMAFLAFQAFRKCTDDLPLHASPQPAGQTTGHGRRRSNGKSKTRKGCHIRRSCSKDLLNVCAHSTIGLVLGLSAKRSRTSL